ncbi:54S ribosomal protein L49 [Mactra antiquata]
MAATIARNFARIRGHVLRRNTPAMLFKHARRYNHDEVNNYTVPYFPEEAKKRSSDAEYPDIEVSTEDFKFVERLLPQKTVPIPDEQELYPTPSGWVPTNENLQPKEYGVRRTRNHMLPCYYKKHNNGRETVKIQRIYGDIWKLKEDLSGYFASNVEFPVDIQVHEVGRWILVRGNYTEQVAQFLLSKGF